MSASSQPTCSVIRSQETYEGKQGLTYFAGISAQSAGAQAICLHLLTFPPGGRAHAHLHENHETAIYIISGQAEMWYGEGLQDYMAVDAGDFVYIPAGVPHLPGNRSQTDTCLALIARTDPNEQESVVLLPELEEMLLQRPQASHIEE
ncbi:MAG TPA: cupin domain-containing protein [Ktedonobacteraceae bacterium]|nr:cupin domain-containing protein [Ktedonobacteraceae bacterium]